MFHLLTPGEITLVVYGTHNYSTRFRTHAYVGSCIVLRPTDVLLQRYCRLGSRTRFVVDTVLDVKGVGWQREQVGAADGEVRVEKAQKILTVLGQQLRKSRSGKHGRAGSLSVQAAPYCSERLVAGWAGRTETWAGSKAWPERSTP